MSSSSSSPGLPPPSVEYSVVATAFNATVFSVLIFGMYSMIYLYTTYTYLSRKGTSKGNIAILAAITALFLINTALSAASWVTTRQGFLGIIGLPIDQAFLDIWVDVGESWDVLLNNFGNLFVICLADGLMIWRCYHVWGQSIYVIALPVVFLLAEIALYLSVIIISCIHNLAPPINISILLDHLTAAAIFMTLGSTLLTTSFIAYRIYSVSQESKATLHRSPFVAVLDAIVQSSAAYTVVSLLLAIEGVVPDTLANAVTLFNLQGYTSPLFFITAGAAPTVMVARVALAADRTEVSSSGGGNHISDLEFNVAGQGGQESSGTSPSMSAVQQEIAYAEKSAQLGGRGEDGS